MPHSKILRNRFTKMPINHSASISGFSEVVGPQTLAILPRLPRRSLGLHRCATPPYNFRGGASPHQGGIHMCGIVGYVGHREAEPILVEGLRRLAYRGYDSAGVATLTGPHLHLRKRAGRIVELAKYLTDRPAPG